MENYKLVIIPVLLTLFLPWSALAYKPETTHRGLVNDTIRFYEYFYPNTFTDEEKSAIKQGAVDEDNSTRALNHFYDPVYNKAISVTTLTSKSWSQNTVAQANSNIWSNTAIASKAPSPYFSADTDYSWDRAVYEYADGNKIRGLQALGHILHLIEDATVPDHTRDDAHPDFVPGNLLNQESLYEKFTGKFNENNISVSNDLFKEGLKPVVYNSLGKYFDALAVYTNSNFFSNDTILDKRYSEPIIELEKSQKLNDGLNHLFGYNKIDNTDVKLIEIKRERNRATGVVTENYILDDKDKLVLTDYWNHLSREAVQNGAGVIKLFFDEVAKEKKTLALYRKNHPIKEDNSALAMASALTAFQNATNVTDDQQITADNQQTNQNPPNLEVSPPNSAGAPVVPVVVKNIVDSPKDIVPEPKINFSSGLAPGFGGGMPVIAPPDNLPSTCDDSTARNFGGALPCTYPPQTPVVISPANFSSPFATTTIVFVGTSTAGLITSSNLSSATTTSDGGGNWSLSFSNLAQGANIVRFITTDQSGGTSSPREISFSVDTVAPNISATIPACSYSLRSSSCFIPSAETQISWTSTSTDISYAEVFMDNVSVGTTTSNTMNISTTDGAHTFQAVAVDLAGNRATSSSLSVEINHMPVVINEIAWAGSTASAYDEYIELYNRTSYPLNLSSLTVLAEDGVPYLKLSGIVLAGGYYLIERGTDNNAVSNVTADLAVAFSGLDGGSGLSNEGEVLSLVFGGSGVASTTLDATPPISACSGWCGGNSSIYTSMERKDPSIVGTVVSNWGSNNTFTKNGRDSGNNNWKGTPRAQNSINLLTIGYYCPPYTESYVEGGYYQHLGQQCIYLSPSFSGNRYGDVYRGTLASSTLVNGHSLGAFSPSIAQNNDLASSPTQGENFFTAIYEIHSMDFSDLNNFRSFFKTGSNSPPHLKYGILNWKYGVAP